MNNCSLFMFSILFMIWKPSRISSTIKGSDVCSAHLVWTISFFQTPLVFLISFLSCSLLTFFREDDHKWGLWADMPQIDIIEIKKCFSRNPSFPFFVTFLLRNGGKRMGSFFSFSGTFYSFEILGIKCHHWKLSERSRCLRNPKVLSGIFRSLHTC